MNLFLVFAALCFVDFSQTVWALNQPGFGEVNPLALWFFERMGTAGLLVHTLITVSVCGLLFWQAFKIHRLSASVVMALAAVFNLWVVMYNFSIIYQ